MVHVGTISYGGPSPFQNAMFMRVQLASAVTASDKTWSATRNAVS